jgi:hypothetical protein
MDREEPIIHACITCMMKLYSLHRVALFLLIVLLYPSAILAEEIPLLKEGGMYQIPVKINGVITLLPFQRGLFGR